MSICAEDAPAARICEVDLHFRPAGGDGRRPTAAVLPDPRVLGPVEEHLEVGDAGVLRLEQDLDVAGVRGLRVVGEPEPPRLPVPVDRADLVSIPDLGFDVPRGVGYKPGPAGRMVE